MSKCLFAALFLLAVPALAQAPEEPAAGPVKVTRILDTTQTRVVQVEIRANATRPLHSHPEALWHVFFKGGTMHGFSNPNARTVRWVELFALKTGNAVALDEKSARELAMVFAHK